MATVAGHSDLFPHISTRMADGKPESYLPGTGLAVWEIAWLWRVYEGDMDALMDHLQDVPITREQAGEALTFARAYPEQIDPAVAAVETMTPEKLQRMLPGIQPFPSAPKNGAESYE